MRSVLTAVIAALEAVAVGVAVFVLLGVPVVLIWWLEFDLGAEPAALGSLVAALWQMAHLVPMQITVTAETALSFGLTPQTFSFAYSVAPLAITIVVIALASRSGWRFGGRESEGAWALLGGAFGYLGVATVTGVIAGSQSGWPLFGRCALPATIYLVSMTIGFCVRASLDDQNWWQRAVRSVQQRYSSIGWLDASTLPERGSETVRLATMALALLASLGALGFTFAILAHYVDIISLSQGLQLDVAGSAMLFLAQLAYVPTACIWVLSWFTGAGFSLGVATSVTPFETLLGPLPTVPLFGALPTGGSWVGALAPILLVALATALGGSFAGRPVMRRVSGKVSLVMTLLASVIVGIIVAAAAFAASGSFGPQRLSEVGPVWWQVGGVVTLEFAFGLSLGAFARRFDVARLRATLPNGFVDEGAADLPLQAEVPVRARALKVDAESQDFLETTPLSPLVSQDENVPESRSLSDQIDDQETVEIEPLASHSSTSVSASPVTDEPSPTRPEPREEESSDPLLEEFSWDARDQARASSDDASDWRSRVRDRWGKP